VLPLEIGDDANPTIVLRMLPELAYCYNTKKRSPYKIAFETIKLNEADQWETKVLVKPTPDSPLEEVKGGHISHKMSFGAAVDLDKEVYYRAKFKGFEKFAKYVEMQEKEIVSGVGRREYSSSNLAKCISPSISPIMALHKKRSQSSERASEYLKSQFLLSTNLVGTRKVSDFEIQTILEKYGRKSIDAAAKPENLEYIPLEKRLEGMEDPFSESWEDTVTRCRQKSPYGQFESYDIKSYIIKGNDDVRQELMAIQFMKRLHEIYMKAGIQVYLRPYDILITSHNSGIIGTKTM
jgi:phosphatidylinositol 4-kinase